MFLDEATVEFASGRGGSGAVSFHREKHVPRGGPDGADGGRGGDVVLIADRNRRTLYDLKLTQKFEAADGVHGVQNKRGRDAKNIEVKVPVGTQVYDDETGELLVDMTVNGMKHVIAKGGKGGKGNLHYTSSVRQAPNFAQKGASGYRVRARLSLKLLADVALVGLPNAGKSTLISRLSAAKPKIADYPFTTIVPNLGVVRHRDGSFVLADMPGLIEGASTGVGLGHQFLKHVERCKVIAHVIEANPVVEADPIENFRLIEAELRNYDPEMAARPRLLVLSKVDTIDGAAYNELRPRLEELGLPLFPVSAVTGQGLEPLLDAMVAELDKLTPEEFAEDETIHLAPPVKLDEEWDAVKIDEGEFRLVGRRIERLFDMTDMNNDEAIRYLHRRLVRLGVIEKLRELGAEEGDEVQVGEEVFAYTAG